LSNDESRFGEKKNNHYMPLVEHYRKAFVIMICPVALLSQQFLSVGNLSGGGAAAAYAKPEKAWEINDKGTVYARVDMGNLN
jgi:hypothetical protein